MGGCWEWWKFYKTWANTSRYTLHTNDIYSCHQPLTNYGLKNTASMLFLNSDQLTARLLVIHSILKYPPRPETAQVFPLVLESYAIFNPQLSRSIV